MTREAWLLFAAMSVIWGIPYLLIKVALDELSPAAIAGTRTLLAALVLLPLAAWQGALRPALARWPWVLAFGLLEMAGPWLLLGHAETRVSSGFAGLMLATVPIVGVIVARLRGDRYALGRPRLRGLAVGLLGVACLVGLDSLAGHVEALPVVELLLVAVGYAVAPVIANTVLVAVPSIGVIAVSVGAVAVLYLPATWGAYAAGMPSTPVVASVVTLGLVCTALAFVLFFALIARVGPVRATVITFINPAVALVLGILVLSEPLTWGTVLGFPLVILGAWWATRPVGPAPLPPAAEPGGAATGTARSRPR
jgi:drug/metabolite transporter (DMT)-like permease